MTDAEFSHENLEECYRIMEKTLQEFFCSPIIAVDFFNVLLHNLHGDKDSATRYYERFVRRTKAVHLPDHAQIVIDQFNAKLEEALNHE